MEIKFMPTVSVLRTEQTRREPSQEPGKKFRVRGKVVHMRHAAQGESGKTVITIMSEEPLHEINELNFQNVLIISE